MAAWDDDGLMWSAVTEALEPIIHLETQTDRQRLEKQVRSYFSKGAKGLDYRGNAFSDIVNEYADNVYNLLFSGLGDRDWLDQADFLLVLDAGVKDNFPAPLIKAVPQLSFERTILEASDRAFDACRYSCVSWEIIAGNLQGKKTQSKVRDALDEARSETMKQGLGTLAEFLSCWTYTTIELLAKKHGDAESVLAPDVACQIFDGLVQAGAMPMALIENEGKPPARWDAVEQCISQAYSAEKGVTMPISGLGGAISITSNQRYDDMSWETVKKLVQGKKTQTKVREAVDEARAETLRQQVTSVYDFLSCWTYATVDSIAKKGMGNPFQVLEPDLAGQLFEEMVRGGAVPMQLIQAEGVPDAQSIRDIVNQAYAPFEGVMEQWAAEAAAYVAQQAMGKGAGKFGGGMHFAPY